MSLVEESITPIISFLHKLLGNNLWILPVAFAIGSWCMYYLYPEKWLLLYTAIVCSIIAILLIFIRIFVFITNIIKRHRSNIKAREDSEKRAKQAQVYDEKQAREHATTIWKYVAHLDTDLIMAATLFLSIEIHDEDKHIRFVKIPKDLFSDEGKLYQLYLEIIGKLTFQNYNGTIVRLIDFERFNDIMYFDIDPYFFSLIENFQITKKWVKV